MIKGMTGFGCVQISVGKIKMNLEARSLNHRYYDIACYLPSGFSSVEEKIRQMFQRYITRGRVTVSIKIIQKPSPEIVFNKDVVRKYLKSAAILEKECGLKNELSFSDAVSLPGVFKSREFFVKAEDLWPQLERGIKKTLQSLVSMRKREGRSLAMDISDKLKRMLSHVNKIQARAQNILKEKKALLTADEIISFQKSADINEEISRLRHYISELKALLRTASSVGKKIDFIAQEMQRETNTIGSKIMDKMITDSVIILKSKIEKIREQSQNIE